MKNIKILVVVLALVNVALIATLWHWKKRNTLEPQIIHHHDTVIQTLHDTIVRQTRIVVHDTLIDTLFYNTLANLEAPQPYYLTMPQTNNNKSSEPSRWDLDVWVNGKYKNNNVTPSINAKVTYHF